MMRFFCALLFSVCCIAAAADRTVQISSDEVEYSTDGKEAFFRGNVEAAADGLRLEAATLRVESGGDDNIYTASASDTPISLFCDDCTNFVVNAVIGEEISYQPNGQTRLTGGITLCAGEDCGQGKIVAESGHWLKQRVVLSGSPVVTGVWQLKDGEPPVNIRAKNVAYHLDSGEAILAGDASIGRGDQQVTGEIIHVNLKTGALKAQAAANQRVQATFGGDD